jgi:DnaA family protein
LQLVLPVYQQSEWTLDNFIPGNNEALLSQLRALLCAKQSSAVRPIMLLQGAQGTGKTHLLLATTHQAQVLGLTQQYLDMNVLVNMPTEIVASMGQLDVLAIDNIHAIAGNSAWQEQLFDLINQFIEAEGRALVISINQSPKEVGFTLADLVSRLLWGVVFSVKELTEAEKIQAVEMHLKARGLNIHEDAISYLLKRAARDMHGLMDIVEQLDKRSLERQRKLTIPFIKSVLSLPD